MGHKYRIKWPVSDPQIGRFDASENDGGMIMTDAYVLVSILYPEDGSASYCAVTMDGRDGHPADMTAIDLFKAWAYLAASLAEDNDLPQPWRTVAIMAHAAVRSVLKNRKEGGA